MRKVLIAYDGSDCAKRAVQYVIDFAREHAETPEVHVLNAQQEPILFGEYVTADMVEDMSRGMLEQGGQILDEASVRLKAVGIDCQTHAVLGDVAERVRDTVAALGCDTVIMGTRGLGRLSGLLLGSVATRVIHEVSVPVVLVK